jgi:fermentation-respiration switch protein FrsA (DUF1100 family)
LPLTAELEIIHGWADDVIPAAHSQAYAESSYALRPTRLHLLPDDHRLGVCLDEISELFALFLKRCAA